MTYRVTSHNGGYAAAPSGGRCDEVSQTDAQTMGEGYRPLREPNPTNDAVATMPTRKPQHHPNPAARARVHFEEMT